MRLARSTLCLTLLSCANAPELQQRPSPDQAAITVVDRLISAPSAAQAAARINWGQWQHHAVLCALSEASTAEQAAQQLRSATAVMTHAPSAAREAFIEEGWRSHDLCRPRTASDAERARALPVLFPYEPDLGTRDYIERQRLRLEAAQAVALDCPDAAAVVYFVDAARGEVLAIERSVPTLVEPTQGRALSILLTSPRQGALICFGEDCRALPVELRARAGEPIAFALTAPACLKTSVDRAPSAAGADQRRWFLLPILK